MLTLLLVAIAAIQELVAINPNNQAMIYRYIAPDPALQKFVRDFLIAHFTFDKDQDMRFIWILKNK